MVRVRYSFGSRHTGRIENIGKERMKFPAVMREVIRISDIILEVFDARFIREMRNTDVEKMIAQKGKKLVYVCNKSDLIDVHAAEKSLPRNMKPYVFVSVTSGFGMKELRDRIKREAKKIVLEKNQTRIHVGIIGYPNAGKSSLINRIVRRDAASVSKQAGHTKGMQKIRFTDDILILDTPGVIPEIEYSSSRQERISFDAMMGARTYSNIKDPENIVALLMKNHPLLIEAQYGITAQGDPELLLEELGKKKNFLKKGGAVDGDRTARLIIREWQEGKIRKGNGNSQDSL